MNGNIKVMAMKVATLTPCNGRKYESSDEVVADFHKLVSFVQHTEGDQFKGKLCNKKDLLRFTDYTHVTLKYGHYHKHGRTIYLE